MARDATAWTVKQVLDLAPDASGARAAHRLARPAAWTDLGSNESLVWGKCQGSARDPYQVTVDRSEPSFRCTCPSRKQPCKHAVALLLLWVETKGTFIGSTSAPPDHHGRRRRRAGAQDEPRDADPEAQARRLAERVELMSRGVDELELWLFDLVRAGTASARRRPLAEWDAMAARLVDAQLPGLADRVRAMPIVLSRETWADDAVAELGRLHLVVRAWRNRDSLDDDALGDLRTVVGWPRRTDEVLAHRRLRDRWLVLGRRLGDDGRIVSQRTWLESTTTGTSAVLLDFAAAGAALRRPGLVGSILSAEVGVYPGAEPARVVIAGDERVEEAAPSFGNAAPIAVGLRRVANWLAANPWVERLPMTIAGAAVSADGKAVVDRDGSWLPLAPQFEPWTMLALTSGRPTDAFGEWERGSFRPLSLALPDGIVSL